MIMEETIRTITYSALIITIMAFAYFVSPETNSDLQAMTDEYSEHQSDFVIIDGEIVILPDHNGKAVGIDISTDESWRDGTAKPFCFISTGRETVIEGLEPYPTYGDLFIYENNRTWEVTMFEAGVVMLGEGICAHKENPNVYYRENGTWRKQ